ncbi:hypothetical protein BDR06DRAFT_956001 [Suillus hirtellus]|nr:hypothetical protein BDR06DRAFT_956001 [Suillus hirtellus]
MAKSGKTFSSLHNLALSLWLFKITQDLETLLTNRAFWNLDSVIAHPERLRVLRASSHGRHRYCQVWIGVVGGHVVMYAYMSWDMVIFSC